MSQNRVYKSYEEDSLKKKKKSCEEDHQLNFSFFATKIDVLGVFNGLQYYMGLIYLFIFCI